MGAKIIRGNWQHLEPKSFWLLALYKLIRNRQHTLNCPFIDRNNGSCPFSHAPTYNNGRLGAWRWVRIIAPPFSWSRTTGGLALSYQPHSLSHYHKRRRQWRCKVSSPCHHCTQLRQYAAPNWRPTQPHPPRRGFCSHAVASATVDTNCTIWTVGQGTSWSSTLQNCGQPRALFSM